MIEKYIKKVDLMSDFIGSCESYVCYNEKNTRLMNEVDLYFKNRAIKLGACEYQIPAMIDQSVLARCGYFVSFPQHLTVAAHAKPETYMEVAKTNQLSKDTVEVSEQYFTPAACLHFYPMLERQDVNEKVITTRARVYRYEDKQFNGITRLWDFTVREIVFIGKADYVKQNLVKMKEIALEYTKKIGLPAELCPASDNFYPIRRNILKKKLQTANSLKDELLVKVQDNDVAIASFNFHDTHFSKPFYFDREGEIVSGCVGFGLERWIAALNYHQIEL